MTDVSGIPNMGFGGGGYFGGNAATGQPAMSAAQINAGMWGNYSPGMAQSTLNNIYGAGGFGAQPAYYAALGAAYGRQVAPSSPAAVAAYHGGGAGGQADRIRAIYGGGGIGSDAARAPAAAAPQPAAPPAYNPFAQYYSGGYNPYSASTYAPAVTRAPQTSGMPNLGYNPGMSNYFANPGFNSNPFQNRFGMGFPNAGTPSQYAPGAQMPPSFSRPYSIDNPGGALPLGGGPGPQSTNWYGMPNASS